MAKVASVACLKWHQRQDPEHLHSPPLSKNIHNWTIDCNLDWHGMLGFATTIPIVCALTPKNPNQNTKIVWTLALNQKKTSTCDNEGRLNHLQNLQYWADPVSFLYRLRVQTCSTAHSYRPASIRVQLLMFNGSHH